VQAAADDVPQETLQSGADLGAEHLLALGDLALDLAHPAVVLLELDPETLEPVLLVPDLGSEIGHVVGPRDHRQAEHLGALAQQILELLPGPLVREAERLLAVRGPRRLDADLQAGEDTLDLAPLPLEVDEPEVVRDRLAVELLGETPGGVLARGEPDLGVIPAELLQHEGGLALARRGQLVLRVDVLEEDAHHLGALVPVLLDVLLGVEVDDADGLGRVGAFEGELDDERSRLRGDADPGQQGADASVRGLLAHPAEHLAREVLVVLQQVALRGRVGRVLHEADRLGEIPGAAAGALLHEELRGGPEGRHLAADVDDPDRHDHDEHGGGDEGVPADHRQPSLQGLLGSQRDSSEASPGRRPGPAASCAPESPPRAARPARSRPRRTCRRSGRRLPAGAGSRDPGSR
jgi:hypothetical protein